MQLTYYKNCPHDDSDHFPLSGMEVKEYSTLSDQLAFQNGDGLLFDLQVFLVQRSSENYYR